MLLTGLGIVFAVGVVCWAILWRNSSILYATIVHGDRTRNRIALTFDDGPHPEYTARTLDILAAHRAKATFFCLGSLVEKYPEIVRRMHNEGHLVANHGFDHSLNDFFRPPASAHRCITKTGALIKGIAGYFPRFYRPPVGIKTPPRVLSAYRLGLAWAGWSRRANDGGSRALSLHKAASLASAMQSGDILLLHDGRISATGTVLNSSALCVDKYAQSLEALMDGLHDKGFEFVRLDLLTGVPPGLDDTSATAGDASSWRLIKTHLLALGHEKASPALLGISLGVGVLVGCSPFFGLHAFIAIALALRFRLHKLAALAGTAISNPFFAPFVILGCLQSGWWSLHGSYVPMSLETLRSIELSELLRHFLTYWLIGLPLFGLGLAIVVGTTLYAVLSVRRWICIPSGALPSRKTVREDTL